MTEQEVIEVVKGMNFCGLCTTGNCAECDRKIAKDEAIKALEEIKQYRALESRLSDMFGRELPLSKYVDELELALKEPDKPHPINARILTYEDSAEWEAYKAIGTVEEIKQKLTELERWHTTEVNPKIKNVFANTSTQICHNCDHKDEYIEELEAEMEEYRAIGTPKECRAAVEKQKAKKPDFEGDGYADGHLVYDTWICPCCGKHYEVDYDDYDFCPNCGQKLDWSDEE